MKHIRQYLSIIIIILFSTAGYAQVPKLVDLGLSVKWADCNLGANNPEEAGSFYAWGETENKTNFSQDNYSGPEEVVLLNRMNDAATANLGIGWRIPTEEEWKELIEVCFWRWTTINGIEGYKVIGPNRNSIFLPVSGEYYNENRYSTDIGEYWASERPKDHYSTFAICTWFSKGSIDLIELSGVNGRVIRPVENMTTYTPVTNKRTKSVSGHDAVDMGVSVRWATCNIGAIDVADYGSYFRWGETKPAQMGDNSEVYQHAKDGTISGASTPYNQEKTPQFTKYNNTPKYGLCDNVMTIEPIDDPVQASWGKLWRMPTAAEWTELLSVCEIELLNMYPAKGHNGRTINYEEYLKLTSRITGNTIILPAGGISNISSAAPGFFFAYWSSSLYEQDCRKAWALEGIGKDDASKMSLQERQWGFCIRPVTKK